MGFAQLGRCACVLVAVLAWVAPVPAQEMPPGPSGRHTEDPGDPDFQARFAPEPEWHEDKVKLPSFPRDGDLLPFTVPGSPYAHFIDRRSLSLGKDDVLRYTVVLQAGEVRNVLYEGIRCKTREHRTIAYGTSGGKFRLRRRTEWEHLYPSAAANSDYAWILWDRYVCDSSGNWLPVKEVVAKLQGG